MNTIRRLLLGAACAVLATPALAQGGPPGQGGPPLRTAVDGTFAPHAMPRLGGGMEGFNIDFLNEIARRLGREITIESASFGGLIPALNAGRYDFIGAPVTVTRERAENLLFTEGYLFTEYQFGIRRGSAPLASLEDLRGRSVAVNRGSIYDTWARANAERFGFTVQSFDTQPDAVQAVVAGRAYANLAGNTGIKFAASRIPAFQADFTLRETRAHWSIPFRRDSVELRNTIENVIECMKRDGTIARISERWLGTRPGPEDAENVVFPGFGVPGMPGHDATPREPRC